LTAGRTAVVVAEVVRTIRAARIRRDGARAARARGGADRGIGHEIDRRHALRAGAPIESKGDAFPSRDRRRAGARTGSIGVRSKYVGNSSVERVRPRVRLRVGDDGIAGAYVCSHRPISIGARRLFDARTIGGDVGLLDAKVIETRERGARDDADESWR
jgi:hypothetical protein